MINLRHTGIYVKDIEKETAFYQSCFSMTTICEKYEDSGMIFDQLLKTTGQKVWITKLITEYGASTGQGDMIELIQVLRPEQDEESVSSRDICEIGMSHIALGVKGMQDVVAKIQQHGGFCVTDIIRIGKRQCCFCKDPEGNGIELIE